MKAVAFVGPGRLEVQEMPEPVPGAGEVVLAVGYCGICGSDLHEYVSLGRSPRAAGLWQPVMGHEFTGVVVSAGEGVRGLSEGEAVAVHPGQPCGACHYCRAGRSNLCGTPSGTGYGHPGAYAEYVRIRADQAVPLPDTSCLDRAALSEPLGVAMHAVNRGRLQPDESVFIAGGGPIGLLTLLAARRAGAGKIVVSEPAASRRELARRLGADGVIDPTEREGAVPSEVRENLGPDLVLAQASGAAAQARELTDGLGVDLAVECVGISQAMTDCLAATRRGGRVVVAGSYDRPYSLDLLRTLLQEHSITGSFGYVEELREAAELIVSGAVDVAPLISRVVTLDQVPGVFAELSTERDGHEKVLVRPGAAPG